MITVFEGPDATGKTTLALRMAMRFNGMYFHADFDEQLKDSIQSYHESILCNAHQNMALGLDVALDRHWPSEYAYSKVMRPDMWNQHMRINWFQKMYEACQRFKVFYVFCFDLAAPQRHLDSNKSDKYTLDQYNAIVQAYEDWMREYPATVYRFILPQTPYSDVVEAINTAASQQL